MITEQNMHNYSVDRKVEEGKSWSYAKHFQIYAASVHKLFGLQTVCAIRKCPFFFSIIGLALFI